ncbi:MAG: ComEC/Rec2 family competence protein [Candidatus Midichloria sp.]|nr:ComEC/Rec2 family competence protein [Candidatus Midichloria sp.]
MRVAGTAHLIVISGMYIAVIAGIVLVLSRIEKNACQYYINGFKIAILRDENFLHKVCQNDIDLFINITDNSNLKCNDSCCNILKEEILKNGSHAIWQLNNGVKIKSVNGEVLR